MTCGDRHRSEVKTRSGYTPDDPCGRLIFGFSKPCLWTTYTEWQLEATRWSEIVKKAWEQYLRYVNEEDLGDTNPMFMEYLEYQGDFEELPYSAFTDPVFSFEESVEKAVSNIEHGICVLEQIEDATEALGGELVTVPGKRQVTRRGGLNPLVFLAVGGVVGAGLYYYGKKKIGGLHAP